MNINGSGGEWFEDLPRTGRIYQLIEEVKPSAKRETRIRALQTLGESGDPRAVRPIIECADDKTAEIRRFATEGLSKLRSPRGVEALDGRLTDREEEWGTRMLAADALGEIRSQRALELLIRCLLNREEDLSIREYVAVVLARIRSDKARNALQRCREDTEMKIAAEKALQVFKDATSNPIKNSWSARNSASESHTIKEGAVFRR